MWSRHLDMLWIHRKGCLCQCPAESGECYHIHSKLIALLWSYFTAWGFCVWAKPVCKHSAMHEHTHTDKHTHTMGCNLEHVCITWFISSHLVPFICQLFLLWDWPLYNRKKEFNCTNAHVNESYTEINLYLPCQWNSQLSAHTVQTLQDPLLPVHLQQTHTRQTMHSAWLQNLFGHLRHT